MALLVIRRNVKAVGFGSIKAGKTDKTRCGPERGGNQNYAGPFININFRFRVLTGSLSAPQTALSLALSLHFVVVCVEFIFTADNSERVAVLFLFVFSTSFRALFLMGLGSRSFFFPLKLQMGNKISRLRKHEGGFHA